jgi:RNA polymerase sigma-70 factor (ECF subfamily)
VLDGGRLRVVAQASFEHLDSAYRPRVVRLCRLLLADPHEAQDVAQEVLVKLFQAQQNWRPVSISDAWVTRVTVNACRDRRRSAWWRWRRDRAVELCEQDIAANGATPEEALLAQDTRRQVWAAFRTLSARQREVFVLRHVEGFSTAEVAEALELSPGSAKRHLFRAVHHLRQSLKGIS